MRSFDVAGNAIKRPCHSGVYCMSDQKPPQGKRFSEVYLSHPELLPDSERMRRRMGTILFGYGPQWMAEKLNANLGTALPNSGSGTSEYWPRQMVRVELRDVLDAVTVLADEMDDYKRANFVASVQEIFDQERVRYSVDPKGGVHLRVDAAFEQSRVSAIASLSSSRYQSVRDHLDESFRKLDGVPADGKAAIRHIFFAAEGLFRVMFPSAPQLNKVELEKNLKPLIDQKYSGQKPALSVAHKQLAQIIAWVDGAHFYRHEPGDEEPVQPPFEIAVHYVSTGASWLRWLRAFDRG